MTPELQARAVSKVKRHESGVVKDPVTVAPTALIREVLEMRAQRKRKMSGLPVVENGKVVGIVTNRDLRFENRVDLPVSAIMTPRAVWLPFLKVPASMKPAKSCMRTKLSAFWY